MSFKENKWVALNPNGTNVISSPIQIETRREGWTIPEFLKQNLYRWKDAPAFECGTTGRRYTHGEIFEKSLSFAAALKNLGLQQRDTVCVLLPNMIEYPIIALGIWEAGLIISPINPVYTPDEVSKQMNDCEAKSIIALPELLPIVNAAKSNCPALEIIIIIGKAEGCHSYFELLKTDTTDFQPLVGSEINTSEETAIISYSSGTTGHPKGAEVTHGSYTINLLQMHHPRFQRTRFFEAGSTQERFIAVLPFFHSMGLHIIIPRTLYYGGHTICLPKFDPSIYIKTLRSHKPSTLHLVTPLMQFIRNSPEITEEDLSETESVFAGAAPIGDKLINFFFEKLDDSVFFQEAYGMTEICTLCCLQPPENKNTKIGSCGVLLPETSCKIVDVVTGENLGPNQSGEICIKGPQTMKGYLKNEKATREIFDSEGFLHTGDIGHVDENGQFYIVDRLKELIKVKGMQVAPSELESVLRLHPGIADLAVIGVQHERNGEAPRAYIVPKNPESLTKESVNEFLDGKVAPFKKLTGGVEFVDSIPKSPSGKILRRVLLADYRSKHT